MKKKFLRSCFALLLSMVLLFGGVRWDAAAIGDVSPFGPVTPPSAVTFTVSAPRTVMTKGETMQMSYSATPSGGSVTWSSSNTSVATVNSSGIVTAVGIGSANITGRYIYNGTAYTDYVNISVYRNGIDHDYEYYIMNYQSKRLMAPVDSSDQVLTNVVTAPTTNVENNTLYEWKPIKLSNNKYKLKSVMSLNGQCLTAYVTNIALFYEDSGGADAQFTLTRVTTTGDYSGLYLIGLDYGETSMYVAQDGNNNVYITSSLTPNCYWSFIRASKLATHYIGYDLEGTTFDTTTNASLFTNKMKYGSNNLGYQSSAGTPNANAQNTYTYLQSSDIFVYVGHGLPGMIVPYNSNNTDNGIVGASSNMTQAHTNDYYISNIGSMNSCRCVIYMGCHTGEDSDDGYNLVDATFAQGAQFVLGTTAKISVPSMNLWIELFLTALDSGVSIKEAIEATKLENDGYIIEIPSNSARTVDGKPTEDYVEVECNELPLYYIGDTVQYIDFN